MDTEYDALISEFTADQIKVLDEIIEKYQTEPGALIPAMEETQMVLGYLPVTVQKRIARGLNLPFSRVYGVATFYSFFTMTPRGRHTARVCLGTACYVRGGKQIAEKVEKELKVKEGGTTADRMFTYETVRCLGACGLGPVVVVDEDVHGRVKPAALMKVFGNYK